MTKIIVYEYPELLIRNSIPRSWGDQVKIVHPDKWQSHEMVPLKNVYVATDRGYDVVSTKQNSISDGFCTELLLANDKYQTRNELQSMQGIPFTLCQRNIVNWQDDPTQRLIAKPVSGTRSRDTHIVYHKDVLPDIGESYIVEKYIDEKYPRVCIDGYVCGEKIGILLSNDNVYYEEDPIKYHYFGYPSRHHNNKELKEKFFEVVRELKAKTQCDNQIIDVEFFIVDEDIIPIEINPRLSIVAAPIYEKLCGSNAWEIMENLKYGIAPSQNNHDTNAAIRCNYDYANEPQYIHHSKDVFSYVDSTISLTFATSDIKMHEEIAQDVDFIIPSQELKKLLKNVIP